MRVSVREIPEEGMALSESVDPAQMDLGTLDRSFTAPVQVTAHFQKQHDTVLVRVMVAGPIEELCGRCLERSGKAYTEEFLLDYSAKDQQELDVTDDVRQEILLSYPVKFLCREDCQGLCPQCGTNLNERRCQHASS